MKNIVLVFALFSLIATSATATAQTPQFKDGIYLVNKDIAPGTYRSIGKGSSCYWERSGENENILDNHYGFTGVVVTIQPTDYKFESKRCGTWTALDPASLPALPIE